MAKAARNRKGDNARRGATDMEAYVVFPGVDTLEGTILSYDKNGVNFEYNRYGSRYRQFFPAKRIITCLGSVGSNESQIWFTTQQRTLWSTGKRDRPVPMSDPEQFGDNLIKAASPDFGVILLSSQYASIVGKTAGEHRRGRKKKPGTENGSGEKRERRKERGGSAAAPRNDNKKETRKSAAGSDWE